MFRFLLTASFLLPAQAFAAGSVEPDPPVQTETTTECSDGQIWSEDDAECVDPETIEPEDTNEDSSTLRDDRLFKAARELAYAGNYPETLRILAQMTDQQDDRVLTYLGFVHRKMGDVNLGNAYYRQAIAKNPNNLLARSYMGQGFVETGDIDLARLELHQIRARGGRDTWPEQSLRIAIEDGLTHSY